MSSSAEHIGGNSPSPPDASNLDTTLLESLFYNEMMMLEDSSEFLSSVTAVATGETAPSSSNGTENSSELIPPEKHSEPDGMASPTPTTTTHSDAEHQPSEDPLTYAEQSLLRDFGVTGSPIPHISDDTTDRKTEDPYPQMTHSQHYSHESWNGQQQSHHYQHPNHDPNRYPPHQPHYQGHQDQQHYQSSHAPSHHQQQYQQTTIQTYIQPRPPQHNVSKGIRHSVVPKQPPATHIAHPQQAPAASSPPPLIPNAVAHHAPQPQHHHSHTQNQQQHPPQYNPHPHQPVPAPHPHHPQQPQQQSHPPPTTYHQPYPHHHQGAPTPSLVPVPAPTPGHHHQSAFHSPPPYGSAPGAPPHIVVPVAVSHHHARPHPHHLPHAHAPPPLVVHHQPHPAYSHATQPPTQPPPKEQLVSQFATLANRLGINLPPNLLASLTKSAGMVSAGIATSSGVGSAGEHRSNANGLRDNKSKSASGMEQTKSAEQGTTTSSTTASRRGSKSGEKSPLDDDTPSPPQQPFSSTVSLYSSAAAPMTEALRKTAEEAIATVILKRSHDETETSGDPARPPSAGSGGNCSDTNSKASYAKRRKKPRLSDCENRLAQLRAENEKLKRHLDNVTNQTEKFEQDRIKAEQTMKQMLESDNVTDEELNRVIQEYSEAYSDYGKRRHEELSFHLDQLEKLANPTNFTKMGLWTIAKANDSKDLSKQNPLIGILSKELNISPQQTRKILDQRQKIRDLCNNLNASLLLLQKLKDLCEQKNKTFNDRMTKTREILTPKQVVKLIMWIKDYSDVLGNICPGWTSEQVVKRSKNPISSSEIPAASSKVEDPKPTETKSEPTL